MCNRQYIPASSQPIVHSVRSGIMRPCILAALNEQLDGSDGNDMRVAVVCEALASGKSREETIGLFKHQADFNEATTAKYVDYSIAKSPWRCETLQEKCSSFINCNNCPLKREFEGDKHGIVLEPLLVE